MKRLLVAVSLVFAAGSLANASEDYLVQVGPEMKTWQVQKQFPAGTIVENLGINNWYRIQLPKQAAQGMSLQSLAQNQMFKQVQHNTKLGLLHDYRIKDAKLRAQVLAQIQASGEEKPAASKDNPNIPTQGSGGQGNDTLLSRQWGMMQIGAQEGWRQTKGNREVVVAVIDTGVDYTHEDLVDNMWRNPGEAGTDAQGRNKATNGVDDDGNGYVDDVVGWDFAANDNKPYDLYMTFEELITKGGNPGHGTHCAGNVAGRGENGKGISGVAPNVSIMAVRFLTEQGQGTTAGAIKSIRYAVDNGAKVLSNSWGSEGEDSNDPENKALRDAVQYAQDHGALFIAAAGNGHQGRGYDNDTDRAPGYPASYDHDIIVSVAAIDVRGALGSFSNWGRRSVDIGAPGVKIFSTVPGNRYQDKIGSFFGQDINWDGTSMATPHVSGAAALYWSKHPQADWREVKEALLSSAKKTGTLASKVSSGGQLDVSSLMSR